MQILGFIIGAIVVAGFVSALCSDPLAYNIPDDPDADRGDDCLFKERKADEDDNYLGI